MASNVALIAKRLDSLPIRGLLGVSGYYWGLLLKTGVGWGMDSLDTFLFTYLGSHGWQKSIVNYNIETKVMTPLNGHQLGLLGSASFAGSFFGAIMFGQLADVFGRKPMFMMTLLVFMTATLICGAADSYGMLLSFRFIAGFGLGGELPVASSLVQELTPAPVRGRIIVLLESFWSIGSMGAVLMAFELVKVVSWRSVFYLSAVPALYAVAIRIMIPESPKWLANVGRMDEAEAIVTKIEAAHGVVHDKESEKAEVAQSSESSGFLDVNGLSMLERISLMFRGEFLRRTLVLWTVWICLAFSYYAIYVWLPSLRSKEPGGYNLNGSTGTMIFIIFWQFPGYFSAAYLVEIIGRKLTLVIYLLGSFVSAMAFGYVANTQTNLMVTGAFMSWFMLGSWGSLYAYTPENYPTPIRAMGASYPVAVCRIGSIAGPYVVPIMIEANWSSKTIMWVCSSCLLLASVVLFLFGFESRGQNVESAPRVEAYLKEKAGQNAPILSPQFDEANLQQITHRLDSLPIRGWLGVSGYYWGLLAMTGFGWAMDSMDTFLFTYISAKGWAVDIKNGDGSKLNGHQMGLLGSAAFAGSLCGAVLFGQLADLYGRKPMFMATLLVFLLATLVCGAADSYGVLLAFRFIAGFGLGGELPVAAALVQELTPAAVRGRIIVLLESFWSIGCMIAVLLALELTKVLSWRTVFYISAAPALYAVAIRFIVPESPKWLATVGRMEEAEAIVTKIETAHGVVHNKDAELAKVSNVANSTFDVSGLTAFERVALMFRGEFLVRTIVLWTVWICLSFTYYAVYIWLPALRSKEPNGYNLNGSTGTMFFIIFWQLPGYVSAAYLVEIIGRKKTLAIFLVGACVSAIAFGYVKNTQANLMIAGAFMSWFMLGAWGSLYAYTPENYPTPIRAMGASYPSAFSRIGAIAGPYVIPIMIEAEWSSKTIMWVCSGVLLFGTAVLIVFGFETQGQNVEEAPRVSAYLAEKRGAGVAIQSPTIAHRIDSLPIRGLLGISSYYWGLLLKSGIGWAMDSMDTFLFTYLGGHGWKVDVHNADGSKLTPHELGLLGSAAFAGSLVGGIFFGYMADAFGRKPIFMVTLLVFMLATLVCGAASTYAVLLAFRFIAGVGMGGELPVASTLVQELAPAPVRGRIIVLLESFWSIGAMIAVLLAFELTKVVSWRVVFYLSAIPALYAVVIRYCIPESPKWLASVGRTEEAEAIVAKIEAAHGITADQDGPKVVATVAVGMDTYNISGLAPYERVALMFRGEFLVRTLVLWVVWWCLSFTYYAVYIWLPDLRAKEPNGYNLNGSTGTMFFIIFWQLPGYLSAAYIVEVLGRKVTLATYLVGAVVSALAFGYVDNTQTNIMIAGAFMSWFMLGAWGALYAYTPENYPTPIRAMGAAYASAFSRIGATAGPYVVPIMVGNGWAGKTIMWVCAGVLVVAVVVLVLCGFESRGQNVESAPKVEAYLSKRLGEPRMQEVIATPVHDNQA
ncbi:sugar phosphate permease [Achlya hypogyna]|uniref:Sugar phosphate permease n=1 Tax=Achlya hypogyna TaxID=1202772 RepID=A0A1V9ZJ99_ACHHY|nr:sugar phosphate permease [Achlya hypogyna]